MTSRLARTALALALPALALTTVAAPAVAAAPGPAVPSVEQVARIYPFLDGGSSEVEASKVPRLMEDCSEGRPYAGSRARIAGYSSDGSSADPFAEPIVLVGTLSLRSVREASEVTRAFADGFTSCTGADADEEDGLHATVRKVRFRAGEERSGFTVTIREQGQRYVQHVLTARTGKRVVLVVVMSFRGGSPVAKAIQLTRLGVRVAG